MSTNEDSLELDDNGNVRLSPLLRWTAFVGYRIGCCVRLEYAHSLDQLESLEGVQLLMTPDQARELAEALLTKADQVTEPS